MYSSRGSNAYGQQQYGAQQTYGQNSGADGSSLPSRQSSMQGSAVQEAEIGAGYRGHHPSASTHFGGPYGAVYGSTALSSAQQVGPMSDKGATSSALQGRTGYSSGIAGSHMFASADYISSSSHGYGPKSDQISSGKLSDYSSVDRRHYDLQSEVTRRYTDSVGLGHQLQQPEIYDRIDQAALLRQQQLLKSQSLQSASPLDGGARRHSPIKEKRREYVCKVHPSCLVDVERDYLSVSKRYPRLFVSPDFTKAVVNWPKENQNISFSTPVSFEHDLVEVESLSVKKESSIQSVAESGEPTSGATIWNSKVILMSGISKDALEELSSNKNYEDRIPHINNILRFSFLRKDRAFMAIGGPQGVVDEGDSSVDDSSLIKTAISYTKDITQLDLQKCHCQQWNRFLEVHYNRLGKDGLFSHKEITVLYIPDLSECLPSLEAWRDQLLAHKKAIAEREQRLAAQKNKGGKVLKNLIKMLIPQKLLKRKAN